MKIHAIRGCNLASLAGEFEIDLAHGALGGAGVFAIVGNTGAGKSTLLDALCVALFDRTPRLTNHSTVKVGRGDDERALLGAQDVRTLLRRGASQGWAEVDFESGDARMYRARWSVRRARNQSDGTLQDGQLSLTALDGGERFGGTKTETLRAIHARLGLSFDQFRRSALLAQGEFAAFLRADGKDRSELLERMTGTEIYSKLSIAAHARAVVAEQRLRDGQAAALAIAVMGDDARAAAAAELELAEEARTAARTRLADAEAGARWLAEAGRRAGALREAARGEGAAIAAREAAAPQRTELALRRRAESLRGPWDAARRLAREAERCAAEVANATAAEARAAAARAAVSAHRESLVALYEPIRGARIAAQMVEAPAGRGVSGAITASSAQLASVLASAREALPDAAWLAARGALAPEILAWPEHDARFAQHAAQVAAIAAHDRALREHADTRVRQTRQRDALAAEHQAAIAKLADAQRKAAAFQQRRGLPLDAARRLEDEARLRLAEVERLGALATAARDAAAHRDDVDQQLTDLATAAAADATARTEHEHAQRTAVAIRGERRRVVDDLRRAAGYGHARAELVDGEECPLCGATEHPWHGRGALDDVIAAADAQLALVAAELDTLAAALAALAVRDRERARDQARLARDRAAALAALVTATASWRAQLAALGELLLVDDPATRAAADLAAERAASAKQALEDARSVRSQTEAATKAAQDAQADVQLAQAAVDHGKSALDALDGKRADLAAAIERVTGERATRAEHHRGLARELAAALARWLAAVASAHADGAAQRDAAPVARGAGGSRPRIDHVAATSDPRDGASAADLEARAADLCVQLAAEGIALLRGVPALDTARAGMAELVRAWRARAGRVVCAEAAISAALAAIDTDARDAERTFAEHGARRTDAARRHAALVDDRDTAQAALAAARLAAAFDADALERLLRADPATLDALAEQLAALDRAADRAGTVVAERRQQLAEHVAQRPAEGDAAPDDYDSPDARAAAERRTADLAALVTAADQRAAQLAASLAADVDARERRAAALASLAAAAAGAEVDQILGKVIGSHDGKAFRSFAQSLTLDGLLAVANAHLEELAPRYQLERVPKHDLELQVIDRDLGSEVRSVQSLSGGESFLVSLALALGLSSMSAHDVRVRTLLIDEGFGTLDPATLDSALSVLDALQATGRQVGVISHVPALVERVGAHVRVVQRGGGRSEVIVA